MTSFFSTVKPYRAPTYNETHKRVPGTVASSAVDDLADKISVEGLGTLVKADIDEWWPIIKEANQRSQH
jgi:hypothetical protein